MNPFMKIILKTINIFWPTCRKQIEPDEKFGLPQPKSKGSSTMQISITNEQKVKVTINPVTATAKPAELDGDPKFTVQSGDSTIEEIADDPRSVWLISSDTPGLTSILVAADADL